MILQIDRERKLILLKWLKQGYIDTLDLLEAYKDGTLFLELLQKCSTADDSEGQQADMPQKSAGNVCGY